MVGFVEALHVYWFSFMCNSSAVSVNDFQENIVNAAIFIIFCQDIKVDIFYCWELSLHSFKDEFRNVSWSGETGADGG